MGKGGRSQRGTAVPGSAVFWSAVAMASLAGARASAVVLQDADHFSVKRTWSGEQLGVPAHLGGLVFSPNGDTLYVIGDADEAGSAVYALPVTRTGGEVVDLGNAVRVFGGTTPSGGLDAGLEFGPAGSLFYAYFQTNVLGQRGAALLGAETKHDLSSRGVRASISGLTFAPVRIDPGTGFGRLQISTGFGQDLLELPLTPTGGVFVPGEATLFARLPLAGNAGLQYVPAGTYAGSVVYANFDEGQLRMLAVDRVSGLPIDLPSNTPMLGTTSPLDTLFASDFGFGPLGLEFDTRTNNDLFVATFDGDPQDTIIQIGGFAATFATTSTTTTRTTTSSTSTSSSTTTEPPDPTTTSATTSSTVSTSSASASSTTTTTSSTTVPTTAPTTSSTTTSTTASTASSSSATASSTTTTSSTSTTVTTSSSTTTTSTTSTTGTTVTVTTSTTTTTTTTSATSTTGTTATVTTTTTTTTTTSATTTTGTTATITTTTSEAATTTTSSSPSTTSTEPPTTSTTVTSSTTTPSTSASSSTSPSTSSTTLPVLSPPPGCPAGQSLTAIECRLDELAAMVRADVEQAALRASLLARLNRAGYQTVVAAEQMTGGGRRSAKAALKRAMGGVARFRVALRSRAARRAVTVATRGALRDGARGIESDLRLVLHGF